MSFIPPTRPSFKIPQVSDKTSPKSSQQDEVAGTSSENSFTQVVPSSQLSEPIIASGGQIKHLKKLPYELSDEYLERHISNTSLDVSDLDEVKESGPFSQELLSEDWSNDMIVKKNFLEEERLASSTQWSPMKADEATHFQKALEEEEPLASSTQQSPMEVDEAIHVLEAFEEEEPLASSTQRSPMEGDEATHVLEASKEPSASTTQRSPMKSDEATHVPEALEQDEHLASSTQQLPTDADESTPVPEDGTLTEECEATGSTAKKDLQATTKEVGNVSKKREKEKNKSSGKIGKNPRKPKEKASDNESQEKSAKNSKKKTSTKKENGKETKSRKVSKQPVDKVNKKTNRKKKSSGKDETEASKSIKTGEHDLVRDAPKIDCSKRKKKESSKDRLLWLQEMRRDDGTWVECCNADCGKWRYLAHVKDPSAVPNFWNCNMNPNPLFNTCHAEQEPFEKEEQLIFNCYTVGSIVWAHLPGHPWWPAIIDDDPDTESFFWPEWLDKPEWYHVTFFDDAKFSVSRAWIRTERLTVFFPGKEKILPEVKMSKSLFERRRLAIEIARQALDVDIVERRKRFSFLARYRGQWGSAIDPDEDEDKTKRYQSKDKNCRCQNGKGSARKQRSPYASMKWPRPQSRESLERSLREFEKSFGIVTLPPKDVQSENISSVAEEMEE